MALTIDHDALEKAFRFLPHAVSRSVARYGQRSDMARMPRVWPLRWPGNRETDGECDDGYNINWTSIYPPRQFDCPQDAELN